ncbi:MAG: dihydrodipicolinate synthase family protein [Thermoplasmata archaeon]
MTFQGLIVPVPTLFDERGEVDPERTAEFTQGLRAAGADRIFALGSLGEFPSVTREERATVIAAVVAASPKAKDVWAGTGAPSTREAVSLSQAAEGSGATALVVVPPYYLHPALGAIDRYYRDIRAAVSIPVYAYNIPSLVGYALPPSLVHRLGTERILAGVKDTSESLASLEAFLEGAPPGFEVLPGDDHLAAPAIARGASGAIMGLANLFPKLAQNLIRAARSNAGSEVTRLQNLIETLQFVVAGAPFPSAGKFLAARIRGVRVGYRSPYDALTPDEEAHLLSRWTPVESRFAEFR